MDWFIYEMFHSVAWGTAVLLVNEFKYFPVVSKGSKRRKVHQDFCLRIGLSFSFNSGNVVEFSSL